ARGDRHDREPRAPCCLSILPGGARRARDAPRAARDSAQALPRGARAGAQSNGTKISRSTHDRVRVSLLGLSASEIRVLTICLCPPLRRKKCPPLRPPSCRQEDGS